MPSRQAIYAIAAISLAIATALIWLIYFKGRGAEPAWVASLPAVNAALNSLSALSLIAGYTRIRRRQISAHRACMLAATGFSALFLTSYVTYHFFHGDSRFPGQGWIRPVYFTVLISHIGLSIVALPLILTTLYLALGGQFASHRRVARWTFPVWLYVSVTGVLVFLMLNAYTA
jgi:putative membrane protein